jgi:hypothetical protein
MSKATKVLDLLCERQVDVGKWKDDGLEDTAQNHDGYDISTRVDISRERVLDNGLLRLGKLNDGQHELHSSRDVLRIVWMKQFGNTGFVISRQPNKITQEHHGVDDTPIVKSDACWRADECAVT